MVFHPSWGYFAKEYGLKQLPIEIEGKEPKPAALGAFIKKAKHHKVKAIFVQPEFSQKAAQQIAKEVGVKVISVPTLSPDWSKTLIAFAQSFHPKAP
jgi:zinc transport system substrate-binding protein